MHSKDRVPEGTELIYSNHFKHWVYTSYVTMGLSIIPMIATTCKHVVEHGANFFPELMDPSGPVALAFWPTLCGVALFTALKKSVNSTVLRIYRHEPGVYTYVGMNQLLDRYQVRFTPRDIKPTQGSKVWKEILGNHTINGKKVVVFAKDFKAVEYYNEMFMEANSRLIE